MLYVMLFCKYPFERKGDDRDPHKFQKILERIQRVRVVAELLLALCCWASIMADIMQQPLNEFKPSGTRSISAEALLKQQTADLDPA